MELYEGPFAVAAEGEGRAGSRPGERDADGHGLGSGQNVCTSDYAWSGPPRRSTPSGTSPTGTSSWADEGAETTLYCRAPDLVSLDLHLTSSLPPSPSLFSVDATTGTPVYGRLTCAIEIKVYEGPFAVAAKGEGWARSRPGDLRPRDGGL